MAFKKLVVISHNYWTLQKSSIMLPIMLVEQPLKTVKKGPRVWKWTHESEINHCSPFVSFIYDSLFIGICYDPFLLYRFYPFTLLRFCTKWREKLHFCPCTLILLITNTEPEISVFVCSHCSGSVKLIVEYWSVFKNPCFCAIALIQSVFKNLRICGFPLLTAFSKTFLLCGLFVQISVNTFTKTEVFLSVFVQKQTSVNGASKINFIMFPDRCMQW